MLLVELWKILTIPVDEEGNMDLKNIRYVKLDLTFGEKIKLLLFGLVNEKHLPVVEKIKEVEKVKEIIREVGVNQKSDQPTTINTKTEDEKFVVPFFNFDQETKSNF